MRFRPTAPILTTLLLAPAALGAQAGEPVEIERHHPFQQGVEYHIEASQDVETHVLQGRALLVYTNHAPESLERLYFHQYLNAFRPNSAWASYDLRFDDRTFQDLGDDEHAFERIDRITVGGAKVAPVYPGAPDSTVFYIELPQPLAPGSAVEVRIDWRARLATEPRRQGREGGQYNWAHWYPRIAMYGRDGWEYRAHIRPGELNGTFGSYDVTLELEADHVMGATGVPASGDPGWESAAIPSSDPPVYLRNYYGGWLPKELGLFQGDPGPHRKRVRWRAEDVHNFAWSSSPDYRYLGGEWRGRALHLLWQPSSERWDPRVVLERQRDALDWIVELFGEYAWPQLTVTDRVEGGATEFPMLYMTSGGAVVHETMHMVAHGVLANNEWREGWLDEGMASFLTSWLREEEGAERPWSGAEELAALDRSGGGEPVGLPGAEFSSYRMYSGMTYGKGALVLRMLRDMLGEETFRAGLREYYQRFRFQQVTGEDFRRVMEDVSGQDLEWFFQQWIHSSAWLDYRLGDVALSGAPGGYTLRVEVVREGPAWMPVVLEAGGKRTVARSRDRTQTVTLHLEERPDTVRLDPDGSLLDADRSNDRKRVR